MFIDQIEEPKDKKDFSMRLFIKFNVSLGHARGVSPRDSSCTVVLQVFSMGSSVAFEVTLPLLHLCSDVPPL